MELLYRVLPWMFLFTSIAASHEFIVYDFGHHTNRTVNYTSDVDNETTTVICARDHSNDGLDIREVLGKWYARELYLHLSKEGVNEYNSCPQVTIWKEEQFPTTTFGVMLLLFNWENMRRRILL